MLAVDLVRRGVRRHGDRVAVVADGEQIRFIDAIPRSPVGKILRRALREA